MTAIWRPVAFPFRCCPAMRMRQLCHGHYDPEILSLVLVHWRLLFLVPLSLLLVTAAFVQKPPFVGVHVPIHIPAPPAIAPEHVAYSAPNRAQEYAALWSVCHCVPLANCRHNVPQASWAKSKCYKVLQTRIPSGFHRWYNDVCPPCRQWTTRNVQHRVLVSGMCQLVHPLATPRHLVAWHPWGTTNSHCDAVDSMPSRSAFAIHRNPSPG